jgi:DNA-binding protein H-NS
MTTLSEIQAQIKQLQAKEAEIKAMEFDATLKDIVERMQAFGISLNDLQPLLPAALRGKAKKAASVDSPADTSKKRTSTKAVAAKYRGPDGQTWSGRGLTPRWMATLIASGKSKDDFLVGS